MTAPAAPVRPLPRRKGPLGVRQVEVSPGRWMAEADAIAQGIPTTYALPTSGPGPVIVRKEDPLTPSSLPPVALMSPPTARQRDAWAAYHQHGGQTSAGRALGIHQAAVRTALLGYMRAVGIEGPIPPPDPSLSGGAVPATGPTIAPDVVVHSTVIVGDTVTTTGEPTTNVHGTLRVLGVPIAPPVVADPGADHAETIPGIIPGADPGHEMTTSTASDEAEAPPPAVSRVAPSAQSRTIGLVGGGATPSGGSEPRDTPQGPPVEADGAATTSYRAGDGPPQRGSDGTTGDFPGHPDDRPSPDPLLARLLRERDEMEMARDELREMLDDAIERADQRPGRDRYLDVLLSGLPTHPTDNIRDRIERVLGVAGDPDAWADGYRRALGDVLDVIRGTRGTTYPQQDIIERIARLAIDVPAA